MIWKRVETPAPPADIPREPEPFNGHAMPAMEEVQPKIEVAGGKSARVDEVLADIYARARPNEQGALADYIPELAKVPRGIL